MNIHFNHLYLVLPDRAYRTILTSDFLQTAFPGIERRVTRTADGDHWSGAYFYTQENYLEFFPASAGFWQADESAEGWGGVAFSVDEPGGAAELARQIEREFHYSPYYILRDLQVNDEAVPWFHYVRIAEKVGLPSFDSWVMEYTPEIFAFKGLEVPASGALTRQAYLSQWNQPRPNKIGLSQPVFSKVIAAELRMKGEHARRFADMLELLGYTKTDDGEALTLSGPNGTGEMSLRLLAEEPAANRYRVRSVTMALAREMQPVSFVFAPGSRLDIHDNGTAQWCFGG